MLKQNLLHFNLCLLPLVLALGTNGESLTLSSLHSSLKYLLLFCFITASYRITVWLRLEEISGVHLVQCSSKNPEQVAHHHDQPALE